MIDSGSDCRYDWDWMSEWEALQEAAAAPSPAAGCGSARAVPAGNRMGEMMAHQPFVVDPGGREPVRRLALRG